MLKTAKLIWLCSLFVRVLPHDKVKANNGIKNNWPNKAQSKAKFELFADDAYRNGAEHIKGT